MPSGRFADRSYLAKIYPSEKDRRNDRIAVTVRVMDYRLVGVSAAVPVYRLVTTVLDPTQAPANDLAALYHERWEVETVLDELKTHLRGSKTVMRSKTPDLVRHEFYRLMIAHFAVRELMHEAAIAADVDPDQLCFVHTVRVIRRKLPFYVAIPPRSKMAFQKRVLQEILEERVASSRGRRNPRGVKKKTSNYRTRSGTESFTTLSELYWG